MDEKLDYSLNYGEKIILSKKTGNSIMEFSRHKDKDLDNIVEVWSYDKRKGKKGDSMWIILSDLPGSIAFFKQTYPIFSKK